MSAPMWADMKIDVWYEYLSLAGYQAAAQSSDHSSPAVFKPNFGIVICQISAIKDWCYSLFYLSIRDHSRVNKCCMLHPCWGNWKWKGFSNGCSACFDFQLVTFASVFLLCSKPDYHFRLTLHHSSCVRFYFLFCFFFCQLLLSLSLTLPLVAGKIAGFCDFVGLKFNNCYANDGLW